MDYLALNESTHATLSIANDFYIFNGGRFIKLLAKEQLELFFILYDWQSGTSTEHKIVSAYVQKYLDKLLRAPANIYARIMRHFSISTISAQIGDIAIGGTRPSICICV